MATKEKTKTKDVKEKKSKGDKAKSGEMKIHIDSFLEAVGNIRTAIGNKLENVSVMMVKGNMTLSANSETLAIAIDVANCEGTGQFSVLAETIERIMGGRENLFVSLDGSMLKFRDGDDFKGHIIVSPYVEIPVAPVKGKNIITIPDKSEVLTYFNEARKYMALTCSNQVEQASETFLCVKVEKKKLLCSVYDNNHSGLYEKELTDYKGEDFTFNIFDSVLRKVLSITKKSNSYSLRIGTSTIYVESESLRASIKTEQLTAAAFEQVINMVSKYKDDVVASCTFKSEQIAKTVEAQMGIIQEGKAITVGIDDDGLHLKYTTSYGKVNEDLKKVKQKGKAAFLATPDTLLDLVGVFPEGDLDMMICANKRTGGSVNKAIFKVGDLTYMMIAIGVK